MHVYSVHGRLDEIWVRLHSYAGSSAFGADIVLHQSLRETYTSFRYFLDAVMHRRRRFRFDQSASSEPPPADAFVEGAVTISIMRLASRVIFALCTVMRPPEHGVE